MSLNLNFDINPFLKLFLQIFHSTNETLYNEGTMNENPENENPENPMLMFSDMSEIKQKISVSCE